MSNFEFNIPPSTGALLDNKLGTPPYFSNFKAAESGPSQKPGKCLLFS